MDILKLIERIDNAMQLGAVESMEIYKCRWMYLFCLYRQQVKNNDTQPAKYKDNPLVIDRVIKYIMH